MRIKLRISNYRCFPSHDPSEIEIGDGVFAIVGENNAGKSAALRLIHDLRPVFHHLSVPTSFSDLLRGPSGLENGGEVRDTQELLFNGGEWPLTLQVTVEDDAPRAGRKALEPLVITLASPGGWSAKWAESGNDLLVDDKEQLYSEQFKGIVMSDAGPMLRAMRALASAVYIPSTRHLHRGDANSFDLHLGDRLVSAWEDLHSGLSKGKNAQAEILEDALANLFGLSDLRLTPVSGEKNGLQFKPGRNGQFRSDEIGAGLAQAFAALFVAVTNKPSFILIDEPEQSLHPALQLGFVAELFRHASIGVVFTTHNLGLAMNAADQVYSVTRRVGNRATRQRPWSKIQPFQETPDLSALLGALSYPSYGAPESRHVLLVEGPLDLRIVQGILHKLRITDQVVLMHIGGDTTIKGLDAAEAQLAGIQRLCKRVWCLIDSEAPGEGQIREDRRKFMALCERLGIKAHATKRRAIENYITAGACARFGSAARPLQPFEEIGSANPGWTKRRAWIAAAEMEPQDFSDVGDFLSKLADHVKELSGRSSRP